MLLPLTIVLLNAIWGGVEGIERTSDTRRNLVDEVVFYHDAFGTFAWRHPILL